MNQNIQKKKKYNKFDSSILQLTLSNFQKLVTLFVSFYPRSFTINILLTNNVYHQHFIG